MHTCDPNIPGLAAAVIHVVAGTLLDSVAVERTASDAPDQIRLAHSMQCSNLLHAALANMHLMNRQLPCDAALKRFQQLLKL